MGFERIRIDINDGVAELTLARPEGANAIDLIASEELAECALLCDQDPNVRAVLVRADGAMFSAGGDVRSFRDAGDDVPGLLKRITLGLHVAISRFARMDAPVIAAVGGMAAGGGMSLACAADLVIAADTARFTMAYTRIGLVPDGGSTFFLPRRIGLARTRDLMLRNRVLSAAEALDWGLVDQVVPAAHLDTETRKIARELAAGPTLAFGTAKRLLLGTFDHGLETQMELETRAISEMGATDDAKEGLRAFFEKRPPRFTGR
ncbi:MAG: enoyl-CoA hydratase/isomerase family protein [Candidatus Binatia bacterium]